MQTGNLVEIRIFKEGDSEERWEELPIASYLPTRLSDSQNVDNIRKRLHAIYFRHYTDIVKIRWNFRGADVGFWVEKDPSLLEEYSNTNYL